MRSFLLGAMLCASATFTSAALADPANTLEPQASLYLSYAFDKPPIKLNDTQPAALRYGFQLDQSANNLWPTRRSPMLQWEFSNLKFDNFSVGGTPLLSRAMIVRADGEEGGFFSYLKDNFGLIALGTGAAILAIAIVDGDKDARNRDVSDPDGIGTDGGQVN